MNTDTGHLVQQQALDEGFVKRESGLYVPVPDELELEARARLGGQLETRVDVDREQGALAQWARARRAETSAAERDHRRRVKKAQKRARKRSRG